MAATYSFADYLSQVPGYKRKDPTTLQSRATAAANLAFDPQRQETERQAKLNELQTINNMQKIKRANAGVDESLAYNNAEAKKAANIRAASSGAVGSSGLSDYLGSLADQATQAQRLNIAATLAGNLTDEASRYQGQIDDTNQTLSDIETNRGNTIQTLYGQYEDAQDTAENNWNQNALSIALGIGEGELNTADLNQRKVIEDNRIKEQKYEADLPYNAMTQYQLASIDLDTAKTFGKKTGGTKTAQRESSGKNTGGAVSNNGVYGLRDVASQYGVNVGYDAGSGNVTVGSKVYTPATLAAMGGFIDNGRWQLPASSINGILGGHI